LGSGTGTARAVHAPSGMKAYTFSHVALLRLPALLSLSALPTKAVGRHHPTGKSNAVDLRKPALLRWK